MADNTDAGTQTPFTISGSEVASVESMTASEAVVVLADGRKATIPSDAPEYAEAQAMYQGEVAPIVPATPS
jgi:hypothetical protein